MRLDVAVRTRHLVPMRDGVELALDVAMPATQGPYPVVLLRTPYDKVFAMSSTAEEVKGIPYDQEFIASITRAGYAFAFQDVRGRFNSDGVWYPYFSEREDGEDTIDWLEHQQWCEGSVAMVGRSYAGYTQWMAAATKPTALKAIVPIAAQRSLFDGYPLLGGVFWMAHAEVAVKMGRHAYQVSSFMQNIYRGAENYFATLPLEKVPEAGGVVPPGWWVETMQHPNYDSYWQRGSYAPDWSKVEIPAFNLTGWYDMTLAGALSNFEGMRREGGTEAARNGQRLVVGPWAHWTNVPAETNVVQFGRSATVDLSRSIIDFLDRWVKGKSSPDLEVNPVRLFVMGANEWWGTDSWPLRGTRETCLYLHSQGDANGSSGNGHLSLDPPSTEIPDHYEYDPLSPTGSEWSMLTGPVDDRAATDRPDVLCYTSAPLRQAVDVVGPVTFMLHASCSASDTDWHVRVADVHPDGYAQFLTNGALRARFRKSHENPELLTPGQPELFRIDVGATAARFSVGHCIRVEIASSWFPQFDRNLNTGAVNNFLEADPQRARQTVFHDSARPSHLIVQVVSAESKGIQRGVEW